MTTYDVPDKDEAEFLNRLEQFFKTVTCDNRNDKEKYDGLLALLREYKPVFGGSEEVMKWFFRFHALELMDDWQEDLFGDLADHLTGFCSPRRKIDL